MPVILPTGLDSVKQPRHPVKRLLDGVKQIDYERAE
jgi:hypothetical protein